MIIGVPRGTGPAAENPQHPGVVIRSDWLDACEEAGYAGMTVSAAAQKLGVSRGRLSRVVHGRAPVTVDLAMKLEAGGCGTADLWMGMQTRYDIARARERLGQPYETAPVVRRIAEMRRETPPAQETRAA